VTIKAIETRYAGCFFRSRLEARWAVAFDHDSVLVPGGDILASPPGLPTPFLTADAILAAKSARFEHGQSGAT